MRILFIHGRAQEHSSQEELLDKWTTELKKSFENAGISYPEGVTLHMPYYGKELISLRDQFKDDVHSGKYQMRSAEDLDEIQALHNDLLNDMAENAGITPKQILEEMKMETQERGLQNNPIILALARILDRYGKKYANDLILKETDDVVTYLVVPDVKVVINKLVTDALTSEPTIIIAHSLGTVIAYEVLHMLKKEDYNICGLITLGSPLGMKAIIRQLYTSPTFPLVVSGSWTNLYDKRDIVSLRALEAAHFKVNPEILNIDVINKTDNRHGIEGYLSNAFVAKSISDIMACNE
ncbi:hypothetical protein [Chryseobacterium indologenes]|uniref:Alpha/beta hydrolase n=1 Tax=Chryseobacterium indologenes TaxID=253 RepID=A0A0N1KT84_CHRID|nr:hypothetical protein [Chryseobacterium indologenes]KPE52950.1 hypothetical protein AOB46_02895 [Chryseobacterium indologenes]